MSNKSGNSLIASLLAFVIMVAVLLPLLAGYNQTVIKMEEIREKNQKEIVDESTINFWQ